MIAGAFVDFLDQGYVYKGLKPVNWCIHDRTALAEAEVEYENHSSPSIWVRFALTSDPGAIDPALAGQARLRPDLDHHSVDHPGQHGDRLSTRRFEYVAVGCGGRRLHRRGGSAQGHGGEVRLARSADARRRSRAIASKAPSSGIRFSSAIRSASWAIT